MLDGTFHYIKYTPETGVRMGRYKPNHLDGGCYIDTFYKPAEIHMIVLDAWVVPNYF